MQKLRFKKQSQKVDKKLLILTLLLTLLGIIAITDASSPMALREFSDEFYFAKQQIVWAAIGIFLLLLFSKIKYKFWQKVATPFFFLTVLGLIAVLIPGIGFRFLGAKRWIIAGPISFQPSEFVKLSLAAYLAKVAVSKKGPMSFFIPIILVSILIMLQPDLGTTLVLVSEAFFQIFISGISLSYIFWGGLIAGFISTLLIITSDYRRDRLITFLEQTRDPLGKGYHIRQILLALGSGGIFGVGLGKSRQKYLFLPETATDSIFAVIAEEMGFLGASFIISLLALFVFWGLRIARSAPDKFSQVLAYGIISWIAMQVFLNIGSIVAVVPLTGIPLPFFSYGGSSLITILVATGILLNISRYSDAKRQ